MFTHHIEKTKPWININWRILADIGKTREIQTITPYEISKQKFAGVIRRRKVTSLVSLNLRKVLKTIKINNFRRKAMVTRGQHR